MTRLDATAAATLVAAAIGEARTQGLRPMAVVVVDAAAQVIATLREPAASALRIDIALGKAAAAVGMGANTRTLSARAEKMPVFFGAVAAAASQKFIAQTGAVLITDAAGTVLGAAGASGGTGDEDERICIAGIAAARLEHA
ncbi:MAG TPA: heme-binding protein [Methylibium sp.]|uniref:heme-binding protein n=1 Tax=Methylibium sp. TaxID=2067992 RepID=UPI002DB7E54D|nr:heme-binding protein [Methylibium sp.]HEU4459664.1 heme-binding protein [Methylibium sp.]